jgi:hypothetical protein
MGHHREPTSAPSSIFGPSHLRSLLLILTGITGSLLRRRYFVFYPQSICQKENKKTKKQGTSAI